MKIMVWNIEQFTQKKLEDYYYEKQTTFGKVKFTGDASDRLYYLKDVLTASGDNNAVPDVFAVIETKASKATALGGAMEKKQAAGVLNLFTYIKTWTKNNDWRIVPPLKCNPAYNKPLGNVAQETVAVYYNTKTVSFEGPENWVGAYPDPWDKTGITLGTTKAAKVNFVDKTGNPVYFPSDRNRRPFMVDLKEKTGTQRLIRCLFVHTSPGYHEDGTKNIAKIRHMNPADDPSATKPDYYVACGDFNVNDYYIANSTTGWNPYKPLEKLNYKKLLRTTNTKATHFYRKHEAMPFKAGVTPPFTYFREEIIDNFLILKNPGPQPAITAYAKASVNSVAGSPNPWQYCMLNTLASLNLVPNPTEQFRKWPNFWCIVATSDHAPIYLEIP